MTSLLSYNLLALGLAPETDALRLPTELEDAQTIDPNLLHKSAEPGYTNERLNIYSVGGTAPTLETQTAPNTNERQLVDNNPDENASDCSWTEEDDNSSLLFETEQLLQSFILNADQAELTTEPLARPQRRVVHAIAHLHRLGHKSIIDSSSADGSPGRRRRRSIRIFKKANQTLPVAIPGLAPAAIIDSGSTYSCSPDENAHIRSFSRMASTSLPTTLEATGSGLPRFHPSPAAAQKRHRVPKREKGFVCREAECAKTFDRACDRAKHERLHRPRDDYPYRCWYLGCDRTFMYPKDLRRHEEVHRRRRGEDQASLDVEMEDEADADSARGWV